MNVKQFNDFKSYETRICSSDGGADERHDGKCQDGPGLCVR